MSVTFVETLGVFVALSVAVMIRRTLKMCSELSSHTSREQTGSIW